MSTWRELLAGAQARHLDAIEARRATAGAAHAAGLSYRQIAEGLGLSTTTADDPTCVVDR
ncbi:MAG: hypothetical protein ACRDVE_03125 [Actinocrinis sp.]